MYDIQKIISDLKQIAAECEKVTSDNVSHRIANIEHGIINIADYLENYCPLGWRPASELPPVNENLISELVLCWCVDSTFHTLEPKLGRVLRGEWSIKDVKWWCYPPKED